MTSFQPNNIHNRLFSQRKGFISPFALALMLSFVCLFLDARHHALNRVRCALSFFTAPLQWSVDYPLHLLHTMHLLMKQKKTLLYENQQLRAQQTLLSARLQTFISLQHENAQLKHLLSTARSAHMRVMASEILAVDSNRARQVVILNKGRREGVRVGLPVVDAVGVMGQIMNVGWMTSTVLLIADSQSAVPVTDMRTGERAILVGTNHAQHLSLINLPKTSSIVEGDLLVTSGLGRRYPAGYPVARVTEVKHVPGEEFIRVLAQPVALLNRSRLVLLLWPEEEHVAFMEQLDERLRSLEGRV